MTEDEIRLYARLTAHEFLVEQLFSILIVNSPAPLETAKTMGDRLSVLAQRGYAPDGETGDDVDAVLSEVASQMEHFWEKVTNRVRDELSRRG